MEKKSYVGETTRSAFYFYIITGVTNIKVKLSSVAFNLK
jgi:hypothetical protein